MEFYGYKKCSTCRNAHKHLTDAGMDVPFEDFVANPVSVDKLTSWVQQLGQGVMPFVNAKGTRYRELELKDKILSDDAWLTMMSEDGKLLKRPVLVTDDEVVVGYDKAAYDRIIGKR